MKINDEQNFNGWNALTNNIAPTQHQKDMADLEVAYKNTPDMPKTLADFAESIVADEVIVVEAEDTSSLGIFGTKGFGPWS